MVQNHLSCKVRTQLFAQASKLLDLGVSCLAVSWAAVVTLLQCPRCRERLGQTSRPWPLVRVHC